MGFTQLRKLIKSNVPAISWYGGLFVVLGGLLYWKLGSLLPGYSAAELAHYNSAQDLKLLLTNPFFAPFSLAIKGLGYLLPDTLLVTRLAATVGGLSILAAFAVLLRQWHDRTTTIIGTLLFGSSAWFLHIARSGTPDILLAALFLLIAVSYWLAKTNHWLPLILCFMLTIGLLYVPGAVWFIAAGVIWQWKTIDAALKKYPLIVVLGALLLITGLAPLGWALYKNHDLIMPWLALPSSFPDPMEMLKNLLSIPYSLLVHAKADPTMWLGTASLFDVFSLTMFALGGYLYLRRWKRRRTIVFIVIFTIMTALITVGSPITFAVIIPLMYLVIAAGIAHLLGQWLGVFPRNPIARGIGRALLGLVIVLACSYQLTHYFSGWPHATATHQVFSIPPKP